MSRYWMRKRDGRYVRVNDDDTKSTLWGVASTGQRSRQGAVVLSEHKSGRQDAHVYPEPVSVGLRPALGPDSRPTSHTGSFRVTRMDDGTLYVSLRDVERLIRDAGYANLSDLLVRACGQEPAQDRIVIPTVH